MNLSIDEKLKMFCARDGWNIETCDGKVPEVNVADGPAGVRKYVAAPNGEQVVNKSISYPGAAVLANTWNEELCEEVASAIADEAIEQNVDVLLAPAVNIKRSPLCGRNFEYFSEDPILAGRMAAAYVRGVEKKHVCSCVKHFAANNMEKDRLFMSSEVDERTLHEIYLKAFELAFREKPSTIMSAYNKVNGEHASESRNLLTDILRDELGYEGVVMSDWWAVHDPVKALLAGLNLQMPYDKPTYERLKKAYDEGEITDADVDRINRPVLALAEKCENNRKVRKSVLSDEERRKISLKAAEEGAKTPVQRAKKVVVAGGGNVAMDVTRSSVRLGAASVTCVYRRRIADMTALPDEVQGAIAEGAEIRELSAPVRIEANEACEAAALWVQPQIIGLADKSRRPRPDAADQPEERIPADIIVVAIGQGVEIAGFEQAGIPIKRGTFMAESSSQIDNMETVFAGGDCVTGPATAIRAIAAGKVAAANIDEQVGFHHEIRTDVEIPTPHLDVCPARGRVNTKEREAAQRKCDFEDIECGMTHEEACAESGRCLRCDHFGYGIFKGGRIERW